MNYLKKLAVGLSVLLVLFSVATLLLPQHASAVQIEGGDINTLGGGQTGIDKIRNALEITFIDRAHIQVELNLDDGLFNDTSISNVSYHDAFSGISSDHVYFDQNIQDGTYNWELEKNVLVQGGNGLDVYAEIDAKNFPPVGAPAADVQAWASNKENFTIKLAVHHVVNNAEDSLWTLKKDGKWDKGNDGGPIGIADLVTKKTQNVTNMSIEYTYNDGVLNTVDGTNKSFAICHANAAVAVYFQQGTTCSGGGDFIFDKTWSGPPILGDDAVREKFDCETCTGTVDLQRGTPSKSRITRVAQSKSPAATNASNTAGNGSDPIDLNCGGSPLNPLNWIMCPLVEAASSAINTLDGMINNQLTVPIGKDSAFDEGGQSGGAMYEAWSAMRGIALSLLVIVALVMVISQAFSAGPFDAYTVKKVLPRIFIAVVGVAFSWQLAKFAIGISNDLGHGVGAIMSAPFQNAGLANPTLGNSGKAGGIAIGAFVGFFSGFDLIVILSLGLTGLVSLFIGFAVIAFRNIFVIILVISAPVALVLWILPNTQKAWKLWKDNFLAVLLAFPIIVAFITAGRIFAMITTNTPGGEGLFKDIIVFLSYFGPYFLLPAAFRLAGGAIATIGGVANDRSKGFFDKRKKSREERKAGNAERRGRGVLQARANAVRNLENRGSNSNTRLGRMAYRASARNIGGYNMEAAMSAKNAAVAKELNDQIATGKDDDIRGLTAMGSYKRYKQLVKDHGADEGQKKAIAEGIMKMDGNTRQFKSLGGMMVGESNVLNGNKRWGSDRFAQQAALSYEMRKAMKETDVQNINDQYSSFANAVGMSESEAMGAWIGAGFENQNQHLQFKNTGWGKDAQGRSTINQAGNAGQLNAGKFVDELYEKKGTYQISQMSSNTIDQLMNAYDNGDLDTKEKVSAIAENFMHEMGTGGGMVGMEGDVPIQGAGGGSKRTASSQGSAHMAERVAELTRHVRATPGRVSGTAPSVHDASPDGVYGAAHDANSPGNPASRPGGGPKNQK
jgi:hypothetical protein